MQATFTYTPLKPCASIQKGRKRLHMSRQSRTADKNLQLHRSLEPVELRRVIIVHVGGPHPYVFGTDSPARVIIVPHVCTLEQKKNIATALWPVMLCHCLFL